MKKIIIYVKVVSDCPCRIDGECSECEYRCDGPDNSEPPEYCPLDDVG
jgi:hypothetical protein